MQQHLFNHFCTSGHCGFLEDVSLTFIDKTDPSDQLKREDREAQLRLWHHLGLILKKVSSGFITYTFSICIFIGLVRFEDNDFWIYGGDFIVFFFLSLLFWLLFVVIFVITFIICCYFCYYCFLSLLLLLLLVLLSLFLFMFVFIYLFFLSSHFCSFCLYCYFSLH